MAKHLTALGCLNAPKASSGSRRMLWDRQTPGLALRITDKGGKSWVVQRRDHTGKMRKWTLGPYVHSDGKVASVGSLAWARARGRDYLEAIARSEDPDTIERARQVETARKTADTLAAIAASFIEQHAKKHNRAWEEQERHLNVYVIPHLGPLPITQVKRRDIASLLDEIEAGTLKGADGKERGGPVMADRVLATVRKMFNWWATRDDDFVSPIVKGMNRTDAGDLARDRVLTDDEIRAIWKATDDQTVPRPFAGIVKVLFLTAARRDEVAGMLRVEVNSPELNWTIPPERYKTGTALIVPLSPLAHSVIEKQTKLGKAGFVFTTNGATSFSGFSKAKAALDKASGVTGWRLHDIRRTVRTLLARYGVADEIAERVLGHTQQGVKAVYNRHDYIEEKRAALIVLADALTAIVEQRKGKIVPLKRRA